MIIATIMRISKGKYSEGISKSVKLVSATAPLENIWGNERSLSAFALRGFLERDFDHVSRVQKVSECKPHVPIELSLANGNLVRRDGTEWLIHLNFTLREKSDASNFTDIISRSVNERIHLTGKT